MDSCSFTSCALSWPSSNREKNLEKAQKEAKVKARKEAARRDDLADMVSDQELREVEQEFFKTVGLEGRSGLRIVAGGSSHEGQEVGQLQPGEGGVAESPAAPAAE